MCDAVYWIFTDLFLNRGTKLRLVHSSIAESDSQIHSARSEVSIEDSWMEG